MSSDPKPETSKKIHVNKREKLKRANQRLHLVRIATNPNTPQPVIERMIEAAKNQ